MMTMQRQLPDLASNTAAGHCLLASLRAHIADWARDWACAGDWARACADYYAASATYEELSWLSNAELQRRGSSRETLARDVLGACEHRD